jgi:hypothetical protein
MVQNCANPKCAKPLRYLREGRVFVFEVAESNEAKAKHHMEHYWLCGVCSKTMRVEMTGDGVQVVMKLGMNVKPTMPGIGGRLAS